MNELKWKNSHEWCEMQELKGMNWPELNELTWMNWNEWIETNDLTWVNWNEWLEMNELPRVPRSLSSYVKSSSRDSLVHILSTSSSKSGPRPTVLHDFFLTSSSRHSLAHILSTTVRIEARNRGNRDPPADGQPLYPKKTGFCAESADSRELRRSRALTLPSLMMWLPWWLRWCWSGCHDGATAGCENRSQFGSFLTKHPLITIPNWLV